MIKKIIRCSTRTNCRMFTNTCSCSRWFMDLTRKNTIADVAGALTWSSDTAYPCNKIIEGITTQPEKDSLNIEPGHIEIPPREFWENAHAFIDAFEPGKLVPVQFIDRYTINLGEYQKEALEYERFGDSIFDGTLIPAFFIKDKSRYYPILPRRYSAILFDSWPEIYKEHIDSVEPDKKKLLLKIGARIHRYVKDRISTDNIFYVASAIEAARQVT